MRIRVHELARELGVSSPRILAELGKMGEFVKSASSVLDAKVAAAVRSSLNSATAPPSRRNPFTFNVPATPRPASSSRALSTQSCWGDDYWDDPPRPREAELTAAEAALELGVRPSTVRQWVRRGYLTSSGVRGRARLYERDALERARVETRSRTRRPAPPAPVERELTRRPVNTSEAAQIAGVAPSTIRMWVHRRRLRPLPTPGPAHAFDPLEVLRVARRH